MQCGLIKLKMYIKNWILFILYIICISCSQKQEMKQIISKIDGIEYANDIQKMNVRATTRLVIENKTKDITSAMRVHISDSLISKDSIWRQKYFIAFSKSVTLFSNDELEKVSNGLFDYFLHYPKEYLISLDTLDTDISDIFLKMVHIQIDNQLIFKDITLISIINLSSSYCKYCNNDELELLHKYIYLAKKIINND